MRDKINAALKAAMLAKDKRQVATLRLVNAAIKDRDIAQRGNGKDLVSDDEILQILAKMVSQREESIETYAKAGRTDLVAQEREEIVIIREFMPRQLPDEEINAVARETIDEIGAASLKDMGRTISLLKQRYPGQMDFAKAAQTVKHLLGGQ